MNLDMTAWRGSFSSGLPSVWITVPSRAGIASGVSMPASRRSAAIHCSSELMAA